MKRLRIATFNINGINARLGNLLSWLEREAPDVVCLQELKSPDKSFPAEDIEAAGYGVVYQGQTSWNGVAILARDAQPLEIRRGLPGAEGDKQARYIEAAAHGILVACLYLPNGNPRPGPKFDYKLAWFEHLIEHAKSLQALEHPVVLAGDFNVVPTDFDIYNTRSWLKDALLQPESRECYQRLLDQGWVDSVRHLHPQEQILTYWDYFRRHWQTNSGLRIDHLLTNPALVPHLVAAGVDTWVRGEEHPSDHAPTWIEVGGRKLPRGRVAKATGSGNRRPIVPMIQTRKQRLQRQAERRGRELRRLRPARLPIRFNRSWPHSWSQHHPVSGVTRSNSMGIACSLASWMTR